MEHTLQTWQQHAASLHIEGRAFINGQYQAASGGATFDCISPIDQRLLAKVSDCQTADVELAVQAARHSFDSGVWSRQTPRQRKAVLLSWAKLLRQHREELALLETLDMGKPISDSLNVDLPGSIYCLEWFAEIIDKVPGEVIDTDPAFHATVTQEPVGVVAAIVPWNFPLMMAMWKLGPALATGNSVVLKPSERSPLSALRIAQLAKEAGLPDGVLNVLPGDGKVGDWLSRHSDIDCVVFTGSGPTGRKIQQAAASSNMKRVWTELGGKSANIVFDDAPDIAAAAAAACAAIFFNMGQVCSAGSRLLVQRSILPEFTRQLLEQAQAYIPGNPLDPNTNLGPLVDKRHLNQVLAHIELGKTEGKLLYSGHNTASSDGCYLAPTILAFSSGQERVAREEVFGPVLSIIPFDDVDQAIAIANATEYGLAAAVWTGNINRSHYVSRRLRAGTVWVNCYDELGDMNLPFGGYKQSGNGRDNSVHALSKYQETKATVMRVG